MVPAKVGDAEWDLERSDAARARFEGRAARLKRERRERALRARRAVPPSEKKRAVIAAAIERARAKRAASEGRG
jgi:electron transport complex protein RnfB